MSANYKCKNRHKCGFLKFVLIITLIFLKKNAWLNPVKTLKSEKGNFVTNVEIAKIVPLNSKINHQSD